MFCPNEDFKKEIKHSNSENVSCHEDAQGLTKWKLHTVEIQSKGFMERSRLDQIKLDDIYTYKKGWRYNLGHKEIDYDKIWEYRREGLAVPYDNRFIVYFYEVVTETVVTTERLIDQRDQGEHNSVNSKFDEQTDEEQNINSDGGGDRGSKSLPEAKQIQSNVNKNDNDDDDDINPFIRLCSYG